MQLLVIRRGGLGDTLLTLPLLRCLRRAHPRATLTLAGIGEFAAPLLAHGAVDAVRSVETLPLWRPEAASAALAEFDHVVADVPGLPGAVELRPHEFEPGAPAGLQLARQAGHEPDWPRDAWLVEPRPSGCPAGPIVLAPGSGGRHKCHPREHWLELAASLAPARLVVVVGPTEVERDDPRGWPWPGGANGAPGFFVDRPVAELATLLTNARAFYGHDSGPSHLAAMLGVPTTVFFVATDPVVWAPVGPHVTVLGP